MEYVLIGGIALIVFLLMLVIIKVEKVRNRANALFLQAEKYVTEDKLQYVCDNLYSYLPSVAQIFINDELFKRIVQGLYDKSRKLAKDLLDDGTLNNSNNEEE